jgi:sialate O-acetylesterase
LPFTISSAIILKTTAPLLVLISSIVSSDAAVRLPEIFAPGMVLQRSAETPLWGWSDPGTQIRVAVGQATAEVKADEDGKWRVNLDLEAAGPGPHEMTVNEVTLSDVLIGQVWLCGGQSNMEFKLGDNLEAVAVIKDSSNPNIRQFLVPKRAGDEPVEDIRGTWMQAGPADSSKFSAIGYHFARELQSELGVPVGIVNVTWGGSACETWMSREGISRVEGLSAGAARVDEDFATYAARRAEFLRAFQAWLTASGHPDLRQWTEADVRALPDDKWTAVSLPRPAPATREPGAIWLRRTVNIPAWAAKKPLPITLGNVQMLEDVWWNGEKVGATTLEKFKAGRNPSNHEVPGRLVREGPNELLLRVWSPAKTPHFLVWEEFFKAGPVSLAGRWQMARESAYPAPAEAPPEPPIELATQNAPSRAFNGMIAPLVPYGIAGVIWYQGENNAPRAGQYQAVFRGLISDWRRLWQRDDLPFFWCQLANYKKKNPEPAESDWAELREAQTKTLTVPNTGQVLTIDVGEAGDIHPRNKAVPGRRLADLALAQVYGRPRPVTGPVFGGVTFDGGKAVVRFQDTGGGLFAAPVPDTHPIKTIPFKTAPLIRNSPDSQLEGFAICGPDGVWQWADAIIDGDTVVVWNPTVPDPVAVRHAWADNPTVNLRGQNGLPAAPFRTDNFPLITAGKTYP